MSRSAQKSIVDALTFCLDVYISLSHAPLLEIMFEPEGFSSDVEPDFSRIFSF